LRQRRRRWWRRGLQEGGRASSASGRGGGGGGRRQAVEEVVGGHGLTADGREFVWFGLLEQERDYREEESKLRALGLGLDCRTDFFHYSSFLILFSQIYHFLIQNMILKSTCHHWHRPNKYWRQLF
jgi:hypothetical protein